jgi:hypothetical protein
MPDGKMMSDKKMAMLDKKGKGKVVSKAEHSVRHHSASAPMSGIHNSPHPKTGGGNMISGGGARSAVHGNAPPATGLMGSMGIIENVRNGKDRNMGIPGIISSTSLGPDQRNRLVGGIIETMIQSGHPKEGPISTVQGHDATAYNEGMVHIRGSHFT